MYKIDEINSSVSLGNQNDVDVTTIKFDVEAWVNEYPDGEFSIQVLPHGMQIGFVANGVELNGTTLEWIVNNDVTRVSGKGTFIIKCDSNGITVKHTERIRYIIGEGYNQVWEEPIPIETWVELIFDMKRNFKIANGTIPTDEYSDGETGQIRYDEDNLYICISPNRWKILSLEDWPQAT